MSDRYIKVKVIDSNDNGDVYILKHYETQSLAPDLVRLMPQDFEYIDEPDMIIETKITPDPDDDDFKQIGEPICQQ